MKLDKVEICMAAVEAVKTAARNIGMVCKSCEMSKNEENCLCFCMLLGVLMREDDFCNNFRYRDDDACADFWKMCTGKSRRGKQ